MRLREKTQRTWLWHEDRPVVREEVSEKEEEPEEPRFPAWLVQLLEV